MCTGLNKLKKKTKRMSQVTKMLVRLELLSRAHSVTGTSQGRQRHSAGTSQKIRTYGSTSDAHMHAPVSRFAYFKV